MRLWHKELLPFLPDAQFKGQLRELIAIMHDWRDKGATNHILINRVMEFSKSELSVYFASYCNKYYKRYGNFPKNYYKYIREFSEFCCGEKSCLTEYTKFYNNWHNKEYLRVCMANLYEKHIFGIGKSRITDEEWARLCDGYEKITGEKYQI